MVGWQLKKRQEKNEASSLEQLIINKNVKKYKFNGKLQNIPAIAFIWFGGVNSHK